MGRAGESKLLTYLYRLYLHASVHRKFSGQVSAGARSEVDILQWNEFEFPEACSMFLDRIVGESCMEVHRCQEKKIDEKKK